MQNSLQRLGREHIKPAADVLGRAFYDDPFIDVILPDLKKRDARIKYPFRFSVTMGVLYGEAYAISENLEGIAVWLHFPNKFRQNPFRVMRCAFRTRPWRMGLKAAQKGLPMEMITEKMHKKYVPSEHWYLATLGVDPTQQGKGIGSRLIKAMLPRIDEQNLPLYLETSTQENVHFYQRFGFNVMEKHTVPDTDMYIWAMLRPPQTPP